jgi:hypothetical protein
MHRVTQAGGRRNHMEPGTLGPIQACAGEEEGSRSAQAFRSAGPRRETSWTGPSRSARLCAHLRGEQGCICECWHEFRLVCM